MINVKMQPTNVQKLSPKIAVIGVGGAGGNAVNNMIASNLDGCEFLVCNTDAQALENSLCESTVQLGVNVTGGLGAGSKPEVGEAAAEESLEEVLRYLEGANMAFVTAGMGGGTGTGAAPVIAKACRDQGILTVGVVTKPFHFEGVHRMDQAEAGIQEMQRYVDTLIVIPNQNLFRIANEKTTFAEAFKMADTVLQSGVRGVTDLMVRPGLVNLDFADIRTAMLQMGKAMMGTGEASGDKRAVEAAEAAINNPLLDDVSMKGANGVIINVTGGFDMTLFEADEACNRIRDEVDPNANIIFGATFDDSMEGLMRVSIVATGIDVEVEETKTIGGGPNGGVERKTPLASSTTPVATPQMLTAPVRDVTSKAVSGKEAIRGLTAPSPIAQTPIHRHHSMPFAAPPRGRHALKTEDVAPDSIDMFDQGEFIDQNYQEDIPRAEKYKGAFIPPQPMVPDVKVPKQGTGQHISSFYGEHVSENMPEPAKQVGLRLNPPKTIAPAAHAKTAQNRSPSLFERITGSVQSHIDNMRDDGSLQKSTEVKPTLDQEAAQPSLDISTPAAKPRTKIDDELDIPAFLRRQAN